MKKKNKSQADCLKCGEPMRRGPGHVAGEHKGERFLVRTVVIACVRCGFKTVDGPDFDDYCRAVVDAYRAKHDLLTSIELRAARKRLKMSQREFAAYVGVGSASVKRWEGDMVQDRAMDELLRLKTQPAYAADNTDRLLARLGRPSKTG